MEMKQFHFCKLQMQTKWNEVKWSKAKQSNEELKEKVAENEKFFIFHFPFLFSLDELQQLDYLKLRPFIHKFYMMNIN